MSNRSKPYSSSPLPISIPNSNHMLATGIQQETHDMPESQSELRRRQIERCLEQFSGWSPDSQVDFVSRLLRNMSFYQQGLIDEVLRPMLMRDFITDLSACGLLFVAERVLLLLDARDLKNAELVSSHWLACVRRCHLWKRLLEQLVARDALWWLMLTQLRFQRYIKMPRAQPSPPACSLATLQPGYSSPSSALGLRSSISIPVTAAAASVPPVGPTFSAGSATTAGKTVEMAGAGADQQTSDQQSSLYVPPEQICSPHFYRELYPKVEEQIKSIKNRWKNGHYRLTTIDCHSEGSKGVYCIQYDEEKIISGLRDNTIKVWSLSSSVLNAGGNCDDSTCQQQSAGQQPIDGRAHECASLSGQQNYQLVKVLIGHTGSVLCLQYDANIIVSGSSDSTVRVWRLGGDWANLKVLQNHDDAVLHLRFANNYLVTCSKDRSIALWEMLSPTDIFVRRKLQGHRAAVNVVDFDHKFIVSASGDRTIKVWSASLLAPTVACSEDSGNSAGLVNNCTALHTLAGHKRGIACLHYRDDLVVSGSSDNTIRVWNVFDGVCLRVLEGHKELVRCIRFDAHRIISGSYDGEIKVWDMAAALNTTTTTTTTSSNPGHSSSDNSADLCVQTLHKHTGRVFRLQFDDLKIVSSSHDDKILIWDFGPNNHELCSLAHRLEQQYDLGRLHSGFSGTHNPLSTSATSSQQSDAADDGLVMPIDDEDEEVDSEEDMDEAMFVNVDEEAGLGQLQNAFHI